MNHNDHKEKFQCQSKRTQDNSSFFECESKKKKLNNMSIQVLRSPSPVKSLTVFPKMPLYFNKVKMGKNTSFKKSSNFSVKSLKTFSERLFDLRNNEKINKIRTVFQKNIPSKGFIRIDEKNRLADTEMSQISQNKVGERSFSSNDGFYDSYSKLYMTKRNISSEELGIYFKGKSIFLLPVLLKAVTAPAYEPPDLDHDWVVIGIIAYKSVPKYIQNEKKDLDIKSRYCVLTLTDLKWEIRLFLFGEAFERYWKVQVGHIIAILNPGIMKPKKVDSGDFSLVLSYEYDSLLELGLSRDLGFCSALKRNGKQCTAWVDIRYSEVCGFHVDQGMRKIRNSRMEIATGVQLYSPKKNKYISTRIGYSRGPKSAEGLLSEYTGWVYDPWNGNVFMMSGLPYGYERDALDAKRTKRMQQQLQKQAQESSIVSRLLTYDNTSQMVINDALKNDIESIRCVSSDSLDDSANLYKGPFSVQSIKRIGFDPYSHSVSTSRSFIRPTVCPLSFDTCHGSDSDLEII